MPRVAVYGTLRKGLGRHSFLTSSQFIGETRIRGYAMYDHKGEYPYVLPGEGSIRVEVYEGDESVVAALDTVEEVEDGLFTRHGIMIEEEPVWLYIRDTKIDDADMLIPSGDWRVHTEGPTHLDSSKHIFDAPFGPIGIEMAGDVLVRLRLEPDYQKGDSPPAWIVKELKEYFNGERRKFSIPYHLVGSEFQLQVWNALRYIPYGKTRTYSQIATAIGKKGSARAIGTACGKNPLPIIIPCHRAVAADGIGGFSAAIGKKDWLLTIENTE